MVVPLNFDPLIITCLAVANTMLVLCFIAYYLPGKPRRKFTIKNMFLLLTLSATIWSLGSTLLL